MKAVIEKMPRSLVWKIMVPLMVLLMVMGTVLYFFNLRIVSNFAERNIRESVAALSREIYNICDRNYTEHIQSGMPGDTRAERIKKALTIGMIEEFARKNGLGVRLTDSQGRELITSKAAARASMRTAREKGQEGTVPVSFGSRQYYINRISFEPWGWEMELFRDASEFSSLVARVRMVYVITGLVLLLSGLLVYWIISRSIRGPIDCIIKDIRSGRKPEYRGIDEFEFLSSNISRMMDEISETEQTLRGITGGLGEGVYVLDERGCLVFLNREGERLLGWSEADLEGRPIHDLIHSHRPDGSALPRDECPILSVGRTGSTFRSDDEVFVRRDGTRFPVSLVSTPLRKNGKISGTVTAFQDITVRKEAEKSLKASLVRTEEEKAKTEAIISALGDGLSIQNRSLRVMFQNSIHSRIFGPHNGAHCYEAYNHRDRPCEECPVSACFLDGQIHTVERSTMTGEGRRYFEVTASPLRDAAGEIIAGIEIVRDITSRKRSEEEQRNLQEQLLQSQKMESIGRLAGGIAHDFNNILSAIIGYIDLIRLKSPVHETTREWLSHVKEAAFRAASLTKQLLAFSRKQMLRTEVINLNDTIHDTAKLLSRMIGEDIVLELHTGSEVMNVIADRSQIEQVLMNLAVNARDAMPSGGKLIIETSDVVIEDEYHGMLKDISPGQYVVLSVSDTGVGMTREVQEKIFEPFFTTKELGKGTGLGLATVYGIIKQHNGNILVYSEPEKGTTFRVYLPAVAKEASKPVTQKAEPLPAGTGNVLIVDDDLTVRRFLTDALHMLGYRVFECPNGSEALEFGRNFADPVNVLLTDVVMPGMNGREMAERFRAMHPEAKVVFMSGYTDETIANHGVVEEGVTLLQKPVSLSSLAETLKKVVDRETTGQP